MDISTLSSTQVQILRAMANRQNLGFLEGNIFSVFVEAGISQDVESMVAAHTALQDLVAKKIIFTARNHWKDLSSYRGKETFYGIGTVTARELKAAL